MEIERYRKKPIVVEAVRIPDDPLTVIEIAAWCEGSVSQQWLRDRESGKILAKQRALVIPTLEGPMFANVGDYIIRGTRGEFYPCKENPFNDTFEKVENSAETVVCLVEFGSAPECGSHQHITIGE